MAQLLIMISYLMLNIIVKRIVVWERPGKRSEKQGDPLSPKPLQLHIGISVHMHCLER